MAGGLSPILTTLSLSDPPTSTCLHFAEATEQDRNRESKTAAEVFPKRIPSLPVPAAISRPALGPTLALNSVVPHLFGVWFRAITVKGWACSSPSQTSDWDRPDDGPAQITGLRQTTRFRCEKPGARSGRVRRAHHCSQSVQMATLSRRPYHVVCALVSALPHFCGPDG